MIVAVLSMFRHREFDCYHTAFWNFLAYYYRLIANFDRDAEAKLIIITPVEPKIRL
jgi:hypothetical protein